MKTTVAGVIVNDSDKQSRRTFRKMLVDALTRLARNIASPVVLTPGATVNTDASLGSYFTLTAAQNFTLANPTNPVNGQVVTWRITQDATGSRVMTPGSKFAFGGLTATLTTAANRSDYIVARYVESADKWEVLLNPKNY
jgi:hypothetical protein